MSGWARVTAEGLDGGRVELGAGIRPEDHRVVDCQIAVDPAANAGVFVRVVASVL